MKESHLEAYTEQQMIEGEKLPENLSSISHDVEAIEGFRLNQRILRSLEAVGIIRGKTDARFCVSGSNGMYLLLNQLRGEGKELMILEERIAGGKNDLDVGFDGSDRDKAMSDFGWDEESKKLGRGYIGNNKEMIDVMTYRELPHFPWQEVGDGDKKVLVPSAEEMIFNKMQGLIDPGSKDGESIQREVKWGVDIKLLKAFLIMKNQWDEETLELYLEGKWKEYLQDSRYNDVAGAVERMKAGENPDDVLGSILKERLGREVSDVGKELGSLLDGKKPELVSNLINSTTSQEFEQNLKSFIDTARGNPLLYYPEASQRASLEFRSLLSDNDILS
jgi:hypothetical protein